MKIYRAISQINNLEQKLFWVLLAGIAFLATVYISLISNTISNVVARKEAVELVNNLNSELAVLEGRYVVNNNNITLNKAYDLGFIDAKDSLSFAYVGGQTAVSMR